MRITDALRILNDAPKDGKPFEVTLACGFTPLHLQTFLAAHLQQALPSRRVTVSTGLYGGLTRTIEEAAERGAKNVAITVEWADLDPSIRLSCFGGLGFADSPGHSVLRAKRAGATFKCDRRYSQMAAKIAISTPTLPLPPFFHSCRLANE